MMALKTILLLALAASTAQATSTSLSLARANPIRKVVTMLQKIQKKVEAEQETETELHEKYMCYCKTNTAEKTQAISDGEAKLASLASSLESAKGSKSQLESDLKQHKADREAAKQALAEAEAMRAKEAEAFAATKAESETNIKALNKAVAAIEKGTGAAFIQTPIAQKLRDLVSDHDELGDSRQEVVAFLSNEETSAGSGEITGVLKQLGDEMAKDLADATSEEEKAIANFNELSAAKKEEVATLTAAIEDKISRIGETGLAIADMDNDLHDTGKAKIEDEKFLADLKADCAKKEEEWAAIEKSRKEELLALADTIKMLNDDDALELFKKTLPSASSFMQLQVTSQSLKQKALELIHTAQKQHRPLKLDLVALALHGKTADFSKVIGLIDEMVNVLKTEQKDDDDKKEYCEAELDATEDRMKGHMQLIKDTDAAIKDAKETIDTLTNEIQATVNAVILLDASVAQSTAQRKKENAAFKELTAGNAAAKDLITMAKKRLNKFYNPKLALVQKTVATSFLQVKAHQQPEETALVQKQGEAATGVIAMMDTLAADLDKETAIAETDEKDAQADYEKFMADSKTLRAENSKLIQDKEAAKADAIGALEQHEDDLSAGFGKLKGTNDQLKLLHQDCDWLLQNYDGRKEARADEVDALKKAKAVLSGASFEQE